MVEKNMKFKAVDDFLNELAKNKKSDVVCPICKTHLIYEENKSSYTVHCQTKDCLYETFRGL